VSFATITLCVASQRVFVVVVVVLVYFVMTQSGNFWIHPRICAVTHLSCTMVTNLWKVTDEHLRSAFCYYETRCAHFH
jgi:hypothetical protein